MSARRLYDDTMLVKVHDKYDVIVAGGGPAGIGAAIAAARNGVKTLLVDRYGFLGGMWTVGLINPLFDHRNKGGILEEMIEHLKERGAWGGFIGSCFNYEVVKVLLDEMIVQAGVTPLYHTWIAKAIVEDGKVKGIITENKNGRTAFLADIVIDCTGDGDVAASSGVKYNVGRPSDGKTQPMTLMFVLGNILYDQKDELQLYNLMNEAVSKHDTGYEIGYKFPFIIQLPGQNCAVVQLTHVRGLSGIDAFDLTKAEIEGRRQVMQTVELFKKYIPQFKGVELLYTAPQIGIRETRRIVGEYTLTMEDLLEGKQFEDGITTVTFGIDIHQPDDIGQDSIRVKTYQIPYRCLVPQEVDGLLVAGRCISGTYEAHASYRVTGNCVAMGQAAGTAAALAIKENSEVRDVQPSKLIGLLKSQGVKGC